MNNYDELMDDDDELREERVLITAETAIDEFFALERARASGLRLQRLERAMEDLRECFEAVSDRILTNPELATRDLERQFRPEGAAVRVAEADALFHVLPLWLEDSRWHGDDLEDRRLRVHLTLPLARYVARLPILDMPPGGGCAVWTIEYAVQHARAGIRAARQSLAKASGE